jgi:hypothetical protein
MSHHARRTARTSMHGRASAPSRPAHAASRQEMVCVTGGPIGKSPVVTAVTALTLAVAGGYPSDNTGAPGKLARSSRWKSGTGKGAASCLVASVARSAVTPRVKRTQQSRGVGYRATKFQSQRPRPSVWPKATPVVPSSEGPQLCRGLRPHHARKDRVGTWEISRSTAGTKRWPALGRRGAEANDART